jgi:hypothetical protein
MRPDHTTAHYAPPGEAFPLVSPTAGDDDPQSKHSPLTRVTFCFAWLFGLEPFLAGGTITQSRSGPGVLEFGRLQKIAILRAAFTFLAVPSVPNRHAAVPNRARSSP